MKETKSFLRPSNGMPIVEGQRAVVDLPPNANGDVIFVQTSPVERVIKNSLGQVVLFETRNTIYSRV